MVVIQYLAILLTYIGLGLGYLPGLRMNRATIALVGAAFLLALQLLDLSAAWSAIEYKTVIFLFGMMVICSNLAVSGFFRLVVDYVSRHIHSPLGLLVVLTFGSGILSALFLITAGLLIAFLVGIPTVEATLIAAGLLLVTRRLKPERILQNVDWDLLLHHLIPHPDTKTWLLLAAASTLAGNLTLLGSVANLIVAEAVAKRGYRLSFGEHLRFGLPLTVITLTVCYFWIQ
jgi:Na+/H+ antiporter NhaD/arsenite permease-like protein